MIVRSYPEKHSIESGQSLIVKSFGRKNILFNARGTRAEYNNLISPLSLKHTLQGEEWYKVDGTELKIDDRNFLIVNNEQTYSSYVQSKSEVESLCIFFKNGLFEEVFTYWNAQEDQLLDDPHLIGPIDLSFVEKRYPMSPDLKELLTSMRIKLVEDPFDALGFDSDIYQIMTRLVEVFAKTNQEIEKLPYKRRSTRYELYHRLHRAKDYIDSTYYQDLDLEDISKVACLSKYHFLRSFKSFFGQAPHQYINRLRLEKAKNLLRDQMQISEISAMVGFRQESSFSRQFRKYEGCTPTAFRLRSS